MNPNVWHALIHVGVALLIAGLSLPLLLRMIPMNRFYGVRFPQSFRSESAWYEINAFGGAALLVASVPILLLGVVELLSADTAARPLPGAVVTLTSLLSACLASYLKARQVDRRNRSHNGSEAPAKR
jgi:hypothetical protein